MEFKILRSSVYIYMCMSVYITVMHTTVIIQKWFGKIEKKLAFGIFFQKAIAHITGRSCSSLDEGSNELSDCILKCSLVFNGIKGNFD